MCGCVHLRVYVCVCACVWVPYSSVSLVVLCACLYSVFLLSVKVPELLKDLEMPAAKEQFMVDRDTVLELLHDDERVTSKAIAERREKIIVRRSNFLRKFRTGVMMRSGLMASF